jgi:hypothetical protein
MTSLLEKFHNRYGRLPTEFDPDYLEMLRMTKYRILDVPDFKPHKCANCGSTKEDGRKYVDFGLQVDWYGTVYLCGHCVHDIANAMSASLVSKLEMELKNALEESVSSEELREQGEQIFNKIVLAFKELDDIFGDGTYSNSAGSNSDSPTGVVINETTSESGTDQTESGVSKTKQQPVKSTPSARRSDFPSLTKLLNEQ